MDMGAITVNDEGQYIFMDEHGCSGNCEGCPGGCCGGGHHDHEDVDEEEMEELEEEAGGCCGGGCCGCGCAGKGEENDEEAETGTKRKSEQEGKPAKFIKKNDGEKCCGGGCGGSCH